MAQVARLNIDLVARTAKFMAGLKGAQGSLLRFQNSVKSIRAGMTSFGVGFAASSGTIAAATYGLIRFLKPAYDMVDVLDVVTSKLGVTTQELLTMRAAAKTFSNMEAETFDAALTKFARTLSDAAKKTGKEKKSILGMDPKALLAKGVARAYEDVADAIAKMNKPADRIAATMELFGRGGSDLVATLMKGSNATKALNRELADLGLTLSEKDKVAMNAVNDEVDRATWLFGALRLKIAAELAPALRFFITQWIELGKAIRLALDFTWIANQFHSVMRLMTGGFGKLEIAALRIELAMRNLQNTIDWMRGKDITLGEAQALGLKNYIDRMEKIDWGAGWDAWWKDFKKQVKTDAPGVGGDFAAAIKDKLDMPALHRGDPGIQKYIKGPQESKLNELVKGQKAAHPHIRKSAEELAKLRAAAESWGRVGIMAF